MKRIILSIIILSIYELFCPAQSLIGTWKHISGNSALGGGAEMTISYMEGGIEEEYTVMKEEGEGITIFAECWRYSDYECFGKALYVKPNPDKTVVKYHHVFNDDRYDANAKAKINKILEPQYKDLEKKLLRQLNMYNQGAMVTQILRLSNSTLVLGRPETKDDVCEKISDKPTKF